MNEANERVGIIGTVGPTEWPGGWPLLPSCPPVTTMAFSSALVRIAQDIRFDSKLTRMDCADFDGPQRLPRRTIAGVYKACGRCASDDA